MKRFFVLLLLLFFLAPAAAADELDEYLDQFYEVSDWALEDVKKAMNLPLLSPNVFLDLREPISRGSFASKAACLVAIEFGSNMDSYLLINNYRGLAENSNYHLLSSIDVARTLGIMEGRGDGDLDLSSTITRQEAAVMLARTYRTYHHTTIPQSMSPLTFADKGEIADWALQDVQLMNHLGIMIGNEWNCFDPRGSYTIEQCLVTLVRLHEHAPYDGSKQENPFGIQKREEGFLKVWDEIGYAFAIETKEYYICALARPSLGSGIGSLYYDIQIVDQDFSLRSYPTPILIGSSYRGDIHARPENPVLSEDGTMLVYTATVEDDVYHIDAYGNQGETPLFQKGVYTVTMDLKTGEQTYTRAGLI